MLDSTIPGPVPSARGFVRRSGASSKGAEGADIMDTQNPTGLASGRARERGIDRVLALLGFLHRHGRPIGVGELARGLRAPRSSTYEIVRTLTEAGLLETGTDGRIFFGKALYFY